MPAMTDTRDLPNAPRPPTRRGFTLVEAVISVVVVGVMLVASLGMLGTAARSRQIRMEQGRGQALALDLMSEILQCPYEEAETTGATIIENPSGMVKEIPKPKTPTPPVFGPETGETDGTRTAFDDVDDYDGWSASPPESKTGVTLTEYDGWTREVTVDLVDRTSLVRDFSQDEGIKVITVTVTDDRGRVTELTAARSCWGSYDQVPPLATTYVTWASVELQIGENARPAMSSTNLLNLVLAQEQP